MTPAQHPASAAHFPSFITAPGETDVLMVIVAIVLVGAVLAAGVFFFWLHSLPERMVHNKVQFDIVAVLALLSLFTHIHAFWVAALLLAFVDLPKFSFPHFSQTLGQIAGSLERLADGQERSAGAASSSGVSAGPPAGEVAKPSGKAAASHPKTASNPHATKHGA